MAPTDFNTHTLAAQEELRIQLNPGQRVTLKLLSGKCESFGTNMMTGIDYRLKVTGSYSFFTWIGCVIEVRGMAALQYITNDTSFPIYANINYELEKDRTNSRENNTAGPTVMLIGRDSVGKTSIARTLCHYALRFGHYPTYIDLNLENSSLSLPGTIAATPIEQQSKSNHLETFGNTAPIVYFHGHSTISENKDLFLQLCHNLKKTVDARISGHQQRNIVAPGYPIIPGTPYDVRNGLKQEFVNKTKYAGCIIDTPAELVTLSDSVETITELCQAFGVNIVFVIDNEALHAQLLQNDLLTQQLGVAISRIPRPLGVTYRRAEEKHALQQAKITDYFYGNSQKQPGSDPLSQPQVIPQLKSLEPVHRFVSFTKYNIFSTFQQQYAPLTTLPLGQQEEYRRNMANNLHQIQQIDELRPNSLLAISYYSQLNGPAADPAVGSGGMLTKYPIVGFVQVSTIQTNQSTGVTTLKILFPNGVVPPFDNILMGSIAWADPRA